MKKHKSQSNIGKIMVIKDNGNTMIETNGTMIVLYKEERKLTS